MATVEEQVRSADSAICQNIARVTGDRGLLSQNRLSQLRNLVDGPPAAESHQSCGDRSSRRTERDLVGLFRSPG